MRFLALALMLALAACATPAAHHEHEVSRPFEALSMERLAEAEKDYARVRKIAEEAAPLMTGTQRVHSKVYNDRAYVALLDVRKAYADEDPVMFEWALGLLRLNAAQMHAESTAAIYTARAK